MQDYDESEHINVGTGEDITIKELAHTISDVVGFMGDIEWDVTKRFMFLGFSFQDPDFRDQVNFSPGCNVYPLAFGLPRHRA